MSGWIAAWFTLQILVGVLAERYLRKALRVAHLVGPARQGPPVTVIKPVCGLPGGTEAAAETLFRSWLAQDYPAPVQMLFSLQDAADPALPLLRRLEAETRADPASAVTCEVIVNAVKAGYHGKTSNLWHGVQAAQHEVLVFSDADMLAQPKTLRRILRRLQQRADVVACLPLHLPTGGLWGRLYAHLWNAAILYGFALPMVTWQPSGLPGGTVALTRVSLERIGGVEAFRDYLAEDIELGRLAVRAGLLLGMGPPLISPVERMTFSAFAEKVRRGQLVLLTATQLGRWLLLPLVLLFYGYLVAFVWALGTGRIWLLLWLFGCLMAKMVLEGLLHRHASGHFRIWWLAVPADLVLLALLLCTATTRHMRWGGLRFRVRRDGRVEAQP